MYYISELYMSFYILHSKQVIINFNGYHCHWLSVMYQVMLKIKMLHTSIPPLSDKRKCPISDSEISSSIKVVVVVNVFTTEDFLEKVKVTERFLVDASMASIWKSQVISFLSYIQDFQKTWPRTLRLGSLTFLIDGINLKLLHFVHSCFVFNLSQSQTWVPLLPANQAGRQQ